MNGYAYHPMVRITPTDGLARTFDLRQEFRDARGQSRSRVQYEFVSDDYEDVNKRTRNTTFGFRVNVRLWFDIANVVDHKALAEISTAFNNKDTVELSLDAGFTYRAMLMERAPSPRAFGGKTIAGARHEIRLTTVELLDEHPAMTASGGW